MATPQFFEAGKKTQFSSENQPKKRRGKTTLLNATMRTIDGLEGYMYLRKVEEVDSKKVPTGKRVNIRIEIPSKERIALTLAKGMEKNPMLALKYMKYEEDSALRKEKDEEGMTGGEMKVSAEDQKTLLSVLNKVMVIRDE